MLSKGYTYYHRPMVVALRMKCCAYLISCYLLLWVDPQIPARPNQNQIAARQRCKRKFCEGTIFMWMVHRVRKQRVFCVVGFKIDTLNMY